MIKFHRLACGLAVGLAALAPTLSAEAATIGTADFRPGQTIGIGFAGLSYDYAFSKADLGLSLTNSNFTNLAAGRMQIGARGLARFLEQKDLSAAVIGGVLFDPGVVGDRSYLIPDLGLGVAYHFHVANLPFALRFNVTLTVDQGQTSTPYPTPVPPDGAAAPRGNVLQRLTMGPNTMIGLAYLPTDNLEVTLGGGTLVGVRFTY